MSDEVKTEDQRRGNRGELGTGTPGTRLKNLHAAMGRGLTLKQFVRDQVKAGNPDAKQWFANKHGAADMKRSEASIKRILVEKGATKLARRSKKKQPGGASTTTTVT